DAARAREPPSDQPPGLSLLGHGLAGLRLRRDRTALPHEHPLVHRRRPGRCPAGVDLQQHAAVLRRAVRAPDPLRVDPRAGDRGRRAHLRGDRLRARRTAAASACGGARRPGIIARMADDFMPLLGWDHVELWVGNAKQAAYFYEHAMGFTRTAYA